MPKPLNFQRYTQSDWYGFAGSNRIHKDMVTLDPLICDDQSLFYLIISGDEDFPGEVIVEASFVVAISSDGERTLHVYMAQFKNEDQAIGYLQGLYDNGLLTNSYCSAHTNKWMQILTTKG